MEISAIASRLYDTARAAAQAHGVHFGDGADNQIHDLTTKAATEILRFCDVTNAAPEPMIKSSELLFVRLVDEMYAARLAIPGYAAGSPGIIGEQTLYEALQKLCPMWPFC